MGVVRLRLRQRHRIIHLVQHLGYADDPELRAYLARPALRICLSEAARDAIAPYAAGPLHVIPSGVDRELFHDRERAEHQPGFGTTQSGPTPGATVLIWGGKAPELAAAIRERLATHGVSAGVVDGWLSRRDFADRLRRADIFVGLTQPREGFYRPALEAMACGCAVVCSDALGNRAHCIDGITCLQPPHGDAVMHAEAVLRLLTDHELAERLRGHGRTLARQFSLDVERARLHAVFGELLNGFAPHVGRMC